MKAEQKVSLKKSKQTKNHPVATMGFYPWVTILNVTSFAPLYDKCSSSNVLIQRTYILFTQYTSIS